MTAPNTTNNVTVRKLADVAEGMWNKSKNAFVNASGDTMTGRLTMENVPINQIVTGTGTAATSSSSGGTTTYYPAKWNFDLGIATPSAGDQLVIKIPVAGHDYGTFMSTDNGMTYFPVAQSTGSTRFTTRYPVNAYVFIVFEEYTGSGNSGQVNDCYAVTGSTGRSAYKVGCWRVVNDYDSGNNYDRLYTANGRFRTGSTGCFPYSLVCLDNTQSYSMLVTSNSGTGTNKAINTDGKFVFPASILYYAGNNTTAAGALVSSTYATFLALSTVDVRYSSNHTTTFTTHKPVYIECTLNGDGTWSPTSNSITQTLRTGYYYIYLGIAYSTEYQVSLAPEHPLYYYDGTSLVSGEVARGDITAGTNNGELNVAGTDITVYTHPTDAGNKHIPAGGSSGQFLGYDSDGTAKWVSNPNTDTKVKATAKTDNANYKILATASASPTSGAATEAVYDTDITLNPSTNTISANVSGTAASAGKLTTARTTYVTLGTASTSTTRDWSGTTTIPVSGTLGLGNGGTGATSAAGARTNLDVYSKSETESLLNGKVVIVTVLPATGEAGTTYYVKDTSATGVDKYDEYIWAKDAGASTESWIHVGEKSLDLSEYVNSLTTSGTGPLVKSLSKSGNALTATLGTIAIDNLSDWASSTDVTVSSVTYHTWWPVAPTSSNQVYGLSIYNGRLYRVYNNKGTYSVQAYDVNTTYTNKSLGQGYGTCATEAATAAKIVTMSDYVLTTGGIVTVKFTNALCASATMNINGKGAKPIYIKGAAVTANNAATVSAGDTAYFMYDGTAYHLLGTDRAATNPIVNISRSGTTFTATRLDGSTFTFTQQDNNTTYTQAKLGQGYGTCTTAEATAAKSVTLTGYELEPNGVVAVKFTNGLCASATMSINGKTATPIYINGAAVTSTSCKEVLAGDLAFFIYDGSHYQFICTDRISKNGITGLSISGRTITYTRADGTTGTLTTQDTTYSFDGEYNASTNKVATVSTVTNAVNALDVDDITGFGAGKTLATLTETDGKIAATFQNISITKSQVSDFSHSHGNITNDGKVGTTADYAVVTTTGGAVTATSLATSSPSTSGNTLEFIDTVSQNSKGKISATKKKVTIDDTYSSTGTNPVSGKAIAAAIETLDVTEVGGDGKYIKKIKEDNGKITATVETMDTTPTASSTKAVTSGGIKTALDSKANIANSVYYVVGSHSYASWAANTTYALNDNVVYSNRVYYCKTAHTSTSSFDSSKWTYLATVTLKGTADGITTISTGLKIAYKMPAIYGGNTSTYLNINNLGSYYIKRNNGNMSTHIPPNAAAFFVFDGTAWQWADYDSNTNNWVTTMGAYCDTAAATAAKVATSTNTVLTAGMSFLIRIVNTNTSAGKLTLNINSQGAKDVWINGAVSSASNYTLPAGEHWCHYDGSVFHIWTDGTAQFKNVAAKSYKGLEYTDGENLAYQIFKAGSPNTAKSSDSKSITITPEDRDTHFSVKLTEAVATTDIIAVSMDVEYTGSDDGNWYWPFNFIGQVAGGCPIVFRGSGHYAFSGTAGTAVSADEYAMFDDTNRVASRLPANSFTIRNIKIERGATPTGFRLCKKEQTPPSHTHGNISNTGTLTDTAAAAAGNDYVVIRDADNAKIQTSTIKGTDVADAVSKKHSHSTLTLSTTAQAYDGSHTLALPSTDPYTSARTPSSHTHGNIANGGTLTDTAAAAAGNDYVVIRDADNAKIQTSTIKGTDVADAVSKKHSHSTLTLSTTAQAYDGSHTLALPSTDPYTSARTPASHSHGNITNDGSISSDGEVAISNNCSIVYADNTGKVKRSTVKFDGSTPTKALTQKGTFETFTKVESSSTNGKIKIDGTDTTVYTHPAHTAYTSKGSATKVPQITTDALGHVISISEVTISGVTPASHSHGNIANGGTLTDTAAAAAGNDYVVIRDADNAKIQTSTIKGTDVADAVSQKHSHSTLTLSTTAQSYDGSHTLALPSTDPYTSARTPASHSHGNIQNGGTLQTSDVAIANGDKLVITDASDSDKVARASAAFDGTTTTKALTQKGTFESFAKSSDITSAVQALDVSSVGGDGKYISAISETDGKISATATTMDTTPTDNSTNAVTSGGVKTDLDNRIDRYDAVYNRVNTAGGGWVKLADTKPYSSITQVDKPAIWDVMITRCTGETSSEQLCLNVRYDLTGLPSVFFKRFYTVDRTSTHKFAVVVSGVGGGNASEGKVELWAFLEKHWGSIAIREVAGSTSTALYGMNKIQYNYYSYNQNGGTDKPVEDLENNIQVIDSTNIKMATDQDAAKKSDGVYYVVGYSYAAYSSSKTYTQTTSTGPFDDTNSCVYSSQPYYCTTTISTGEAWNSNHWAKIPTAVWTGTNSAITSLYAGLKIAIKVPSYGGSSTTQININGLGAKTMLRNTSNYTSHLPTNSIVFLAYDGTYWRWADYNSDSWVTTIGAYCETGADTAAKTASSYLTVLTAGMAFLTRFANTNTYSGKITLNVNGQGAKDLWLNGAVSSSSNCTLAKGEYWTYYDGIKFCIWTDGSVQLKGLHLDTPLPDTEIASAATWNAKQDAITYMTVAQENELISELGEL